MIEVRNAATGPKRTPTLPAYQMNRAAGRMRKRRFIRRTLLRTPVRTSVVDDNSIDQELRQLIKCLGQKGFSGS
jgi:hypothetical protein